MKKQIIVLLLVIILTGIRGYGQVVSPKVVDFLSSTCLATDIITGPSGLNCQTPSGPFIITFFGINQGAIGGEDITVNVLDCNSFEIKELGLTFTKLKAVSSHTLTTTQNLAGQSPLSFQCEYIPPPVPPPSLNKK